MFSIWSCPKFCRSVKELTLYRTTSIWTFNDPWKKGLLTTSALLIAFKNIMGKGENAGY